MLSTALLLLGAIERLHRGEPVGCRRVLPDASGMRLRAITSTASPRTFLCHGQVYGPVPRTVDPLKGWQEVLIAADQR
jgi:hypothetical protein